MRKKLIVQEFIVRGNQYIVKKQKYIDEYTKKR